MLIQFVLLFTILVFGDAVGSPSIGRTLIDGVKRSLSATTFNGASVYSVLGTDSVDTPVTTIGVFNYVTGAYVGEITPSVVGNATFAADATGYVNIPHGLDAGNTLVMFGGSNVNGADTSILTQYNADLNVFSTIAATGTPPSARIFPALAYVPKCTYPGNATACILLTGGYSTASSTALSDMSVLAPGIGYPSMIDSVTGTVMGSLTWYPVGTLSNSATSPAPVHSHSLTVALDGTSVYQYGGSAGGSAVSDLWVTSSVGFADSADSEMLNLALNKPAAISTQDPSWGSNGATVLTDGVITNDHAGCNVVSNAGCRYNSTDPRRFTVNKCTHSLSEWNPWVRIDLGTAMTADQIAYIPRLDCCLDRNAGWQIYVGNTLGTNGNFDSPSSILLPTPLGLSEAVIARIDVPIPANTPAFKYVWLTVPGYKILSVCELQVFKKNPWTWRQLSGSGEVAQGKKAWQTTTETGWEGGEAGRVVDGFANNGNMGVQPQSCSATKGSDRNPQLWIDLGQAYAVNYVRFWARNDCCTGRNRNFRFYMGYSLDYMASELCASVADVTPPNPATQSWIDIPCKAKGRFLIIRRELNPWDDSIMHACEIKVFANRQLNEPPGRYGHAATTFRGAMVVYGGYDSTGLQLTGVDYFDYTTNQWLANIVTLGTRPAGRAYMNLVPVSSTKLIAYGGVTPSSASSEIVTITFPSCPIVNTLGVSGSIATGSGTANVYSCYSGFTDNTKGKPIFCSVDGLLIGTNTPCTPSTPGAPTGVSISQITNSSVLVSWTAPTGTGYYPTITGYRVHTVVPTDYELTILASGPSEGYSAWNFSAPRLASTPAGGNPTESWFRFDQEDNQLIIDAGPGADAWGSYWGGNGARGTAPVAFMNEWPAGIDLNQDLAIEGHVIMDYTDHSFGATDTMFGGICAFDKKKNVITVYLGLRLWNWGSQFQIIFESPTSCGGSGCFWDTGLSWANSLNGLTTDGTPNNHYDVYLRMEHITNATGAASNIAKSPAAAYRPPHWRAMYRFSQSEDWISFSTIYPDLLTYGGSMYMPDVRPAMLVRNGNGGQRGLFRFDSFAVRSSNFFKPGSTRVVSGSNNSAVVYGLTPGQAYSFQVEASTAAGWGASSATASATTLAALTLATWNSTTNNRLVNVARGRPTNQSTAYSGQVNAKLPAYGSYMVDGNRGNLWYVSGCAFGQDADVNPWFTVDLGVETDVKHINIYGRGDWPAPDGADTFITVGNTGNWYEDAIVQLPVLYALATINQGPDYMASVNMPAGTRGRYVTVKTGVGAWGSDGQPGSFGFGVCELEVYAPNTCLTQDWNNVYWVSGQCDSDDAYNNRAVWGSICTRGCQNGMKPYRGTFVNYCGGETWKYPQLDCRPVCPDLTMPVDAATCSFDLAYFDFNDNNMLELNDWTPLQPSRTPKGKNFFFLDNVMQIRTRTPDADAVVFPRYNQIANVISDPLTIVVNVSTTMRAGISYRISEAANSYYRYFVDIQRQVLTCELVIDTYVLELAEVPLPFVVAPNTWVTLSVNVGAFFHNFYINGRFMMTAADNQLASGFTGTYAFRDAFFDNFQVSDDCTNEGFATGVFPGRTATFACKTGYTLSGNSTLSCAINSALPTIANWVGTVPTCVLSSPRVFVTGVFAVSEAAAAGTAIGIPIVASDDVPSAQVLFAITAGNSDYAFAIDSCGGQISVRRAGVLNYKNAPTRIITVSSYIPDYPTAITFTNVTVNVLLAVTSPTVPDQLFNISENTLGGTVVGTIAYADRFNATVSWSVVSDESNGLFTLDPVSGVITVSASVVSGPNMTASNWLNFEGVRNSFHITVKATNAGNSALAATAMITINLIDKDDAPVLQSPQQVIIFNTTDAAAGVGFVLRTPVIATKEDKLAFASPIIYTLIAPSTAIKTPQCGGTIGVNNAFASTIPTTDGNSSSPALFSINVLSGQLTLINAPAPPFRTRPVISAGGVAAHAQYNLCLNVTDSFGGFNVGVVQVVVANNEGSPIITGTGGFFTTLNTRGGQVVYFYGTGFSMNATITANYTYGGYDYWHMYGQNCSVMNPTTIACYSDAGAGNFLVWKVYQDYKYIPMTAVFYGSYIPPRVDRLSCTTAGVAHSCLAMPTTGNTDIQMFGDYFEPPGDYVFAIGAACCYTATYIFYYTYTGLGGTQSYFLADPVFATGNFTYMDWISPAGAGASAPGGYGYVGLQSLPASSVLFGYAAPAISNIAVPVNSSYRIDDLLPIGGQVFIITGTNFGPTTSNIVVKYGIIGSENTAVCSARAAATSHSSISCVTIAGSGGVNLRVQISVNGQLFTSAGTTALGYGLSFRGGVPGSVTGFTSLSTLGGGSFNIVGNGFGSVAQYGVATGAITVTYGPASAPTRYAATGCRVTVTDTTISCNAAPGVGQDFIFVVTQDGRALSSLDTRGFTAYAAPKVFSITGPGSLSPTSGGYQVIINGDMFGPADAVTNAQIVATYTQPFVAFNPAISPIVLQAKSCIISIAHTQITCNTAPGAGIDLEWSVAVGGQGSTLPLSSYAQPTVTDLRYHSSVGGGQMRYIDPNLFSMSNWVPAGKPTGDAINWAVLTGTNFGPANLTFYNRSGTFSLVEKISYGPTGYEYVVQDWIHVDDTTIYIRLIPLSGNNHIFYVWVGDQQSTASTFTLGTYGMAILSMTPLFGPVHNPPGAGAEIAIVCTWCPLLDPTIKLVVYMGGGASGNRPVRIVPLTYPDTTAGLLAARLPDWNSHNVTFILPEYFGGYDIPIRVVAQPVKDTAVDPNTFTWFTWQNRASAVTGANLFRYFNPVIDRVVVKKAVWLQPFGNTVWRMINGTNTSVFTPTLPLTYPAWDRGTSDLRPVPCFFPNNPADYWQCDPLAKYPGQQLLQINIYGKNFGVDNWAFWKYGDDGLSRNIDLINFYQTTWSVGQNVWTYYWSDEVITAWTYTDAGRIRVDLQSQAYNGTTVSQYSNDVGFFLVAPTFYSVTGAISNNPTTGGDINNVITIVLDDLETSTDLKVTIGGNPCTLLTAPGGLPITNAFTQIIQPQILAPVKRWTLYVRVPPGQGTNNKLTIIRYTQVANLYNDTSDWSGYISYIAPVLTRLDTWVWWPDNANFRGPYWYIGGAFANGGSFRVPTNGTNIRLRGTNLGTKPVIKAADGWTITSTSYPLNLWECFGTEGTHTCYEWITPPGEGTGQTFTEYSQSGFFFELFAGDQPSAFGNFRYNLPNVYSITTSAGAPSTGLTPTGQPILVTITGREFGQTNKNRAPGTSNLQVYFYRSGDATTTQVTCGNVTRYSHFLMTCILPPGTGYNLNARINVLDQLGDTNPTTTIQTYTNGALVYGNPFSYDAPVISEVYAVTAFDNTVTTVCTIVNNEYYDIYANQTLNNFTNVCTTVTTGVSSSLITVTKPQVYVPGVGAAVLTGGFTNSSLLLSGPTKDRATYITVIGNNFGTTYNSAVQCPLLSWPGRSNAYKFYTNQRCNGAEDYLGEGEVTSSYVVSWTDTKVVFAVPAGYGHKEIDLAVRGQGITVPRTSPLRPILTFNAPVITKMLPNLLDTHGGQLISIEGYNFGPAPRNRTLPAIATSNAYGVFSTAQTPSVGASLATSTRVIDFSYTCISASYDLNGMPLTPCLDTVVSWSENIITFYSAPGVGVNKNATVSVIDSSAITSNKASYSYMAPVVQSASPSVILLGDPAKVVTTTIVGHQFGDNTLASTQGWVASDLILWVMIGGTQVTSVTRLPFDPRLGEANLFVTVNPLTLQGQRNITVHVAGQETTSPNLATRTVIVGCQDGYYGAINTTCNKCPPYGVDCVGYNPTLANFEARFTMPVAQAGYRVFMGDSATQYCSANQIYPGPICVRTCFPAESCSGGSISYLNSNSAVSPCAPGYTTLTSSGMCNSAASGYYISGGVSIPCPAGAPAIIIFYIILILVASAIAYVLQNLNVYIAFAGIAMDYFQIIAMMILNSGAGWPKVVSQLSLVLSAFYLNVEIVAPECISINNGGSLFTQKFAAVLLLPIATVAAFGVFHLGFMLFKIMTLRPKKTWNAHGSKLIASALIMWYFLYIYEVNTTLQPFNCVKADGGYFFPATMELCSTGTNNSVYGAGIAGIVVYVCLYPLITAIFFYTSRELIMEDQLLRAKGVGDDRLSNPHAFMLRQRFGRMYYQYRPDYFWWQLVVLLRKLFIGLIPVVFNANAVYQMASSAIVLVVAYGLQLKFSPYMNPGDYEVILREHQAAVFTSALHARLQASIAGIESRGKKRVHKNLLTYDGKVDRKAALSVLTNWFFDYNTVEGVLTFIEAIVAILGVIFLTASASSGGAYSYGPQAATDLVLILVIFGIVYVAAVMATELYILSTTKTRLAIAGDKRRTSRSIKKLEEDGAASPAKRSGSSRKLGAEPVSMAVSETAINPLFASQKGTAGASAIATPEALQSIMSYTDAPPTEMWHNIQKAIQEQYNQNLALTAELAAARADNDKNTASNPVRGKAAFDPTQVATYASSRKL